MVASNIIEAASLGIAGSVFTVAIVAANLIGFVAMQYFLDAILGQFTISMGIFCRDLIYL
jgi:nucleoside permease NupC